MFINENHISTYNARLLGRFIDPLEFENEMLTPDGSLNSIVYNTKLGRKTLRLSLEFYGTPSEILVNKSRFTKEALDNPEIRFKSIKDRVFEGYSTYMSIGEQNYLFETIDVDFVVIEKSESLIRNFTNQATIDLYCTMDTPAVIEITPNEDSNEIIIDGFTESIKVRNVKKGKTITIDGEDSLVIEDGANKFLDYDSWGFPILKVGRNDITISGNNNVRILYSPRWL